MTFTDLCALPSSFVDLRRLSWTLTSLKIFTGSDKEEYTFDRIRSEFQQTNGRMVAEELNPQTVDWHDVLRRDVTRFATADPMNQLKRVSSWLACRETIEFPRKWREFIRIGPGLRSLGACRDKVPGKLCPSLPRKSAIDPPFSDSTFVQSLIQIHSSNHLDYTIGYFQCEKKTLTNESKISEFFVLKLHDSHNCTIKKFRSVAVRLTRSIARVESNWLASFTSECHL